MDEPAPPAKPEPSPFERMRELAIRVLSAPKTEVDRRKKIGVVNEKVAKGN